MGDYVVYPYPYAKFYHDTITPFCPLICENAHQVTRLVFLVFLTAKTPAPIFILNTSNNVVSRKDVPFGVSKTKFCISTYFQPKTKILGQLSTAQQGLNNGDAQL